MGGGWACTCLGSEGGAPEEQEGGGFQPALRMIGCCTAAATILHVTSLSEKLCLMTS